MVTDLFTWPIRIRSVDLKESEVWVILDQIVADIESTWTTNELPVFARRELFVADVTWVVPFHDSDDHANLALAVKVALEQVCDLRVAIGNHFGCAVQLFFTQNFHARSQCHERVVDASSHPEALSTSLGTTISLASSQIDER